MVRDLREASWGRRNRLESTLELCGGRSTSGQEGKVRLDVWRTT